MIAETGVTFKELEKNIYSWICGIGRQFTSDFMERYDQMLMEEERIKELFEYLEIYKNSLWEEREIEDAEDLIRYYKNNR